MMKLSATVLRSVGMDMKTAMIKWCFSKCMDF